MPSNRAHSHVYWIVAAAAGSLLNAALFLTLPRLGQRPAAPPPPAIAVELMAWQAPAQAAPVPKPESKPEPKPVSQPRSEPQPRPQPSSQPPAPPKPEAVQPAPMERPVQSSPSTEPELAKDSEAPVTPPVPAQQSSQPKEEEIPPVPVPIFELTRMPQFVHRETPVYPPLMRSQGREAEVKLEVLVDANGKVRRVAVIGSGGEAFDAAAVAALRASTFTPGHVEARPVAVLMRVPVKFKLR